MANERNLIAEGGYRQSFTKASNATVYTSGDLVQLNGSGLVTQLFSSSTSNQLVNTDKILGQVDYYLVNGTNESKLSVNVADDTFYLWMPLAVLNTGEYTRVTAATADLMDAVGIARVQSDNAETGIADKYVAAQGAATTCGVIVDVDTDTNQVKVHINAANRQRG